MSGERKEDETKGMRKRRKKDGKQRGDQGKRERERECVNARVREREKNGGVK